MMQAIVKTHQFVDEVLTTLTESFGYNLIMGRVVGEFDRVRGVVEVDR